MSWRYLQHFFSVIISRLPRRLEYISQDLLKKSWETKNCYAENVLKTSWRHVLKTSWRHVLKTSWRHVLKTSSTRLQRNNFTSSKTSWRRFQDLSQDVFKTSSRRLGRRKIVTLKASWRRLEDMSWRHLEDISWRLLQGMSWRRLQDVLETNKMFTGDICI